MRDFNWFDELYTVVKNDGTYAGVPCRTLEEAIELQNQHEDSKIFLLVYDNQNFANEMDESDFQDSFVPGRIRQLAQIFSNNLCTFYLINFQKVVDFL